MEQLSVWASHGRDPVQVLWFAGAERKPFKAFRKSWRKQTMLSNLPKKNLKLIIV